MCCGDLKYAKKHHNHANLYYTQQQVDSLIADFYTKAEIDALIADFYTKAEIDALFNQLIADWLIPEDWITPTLLNGWSNFGSGFNPAGYFTDTTGVVHLRGLVAGGSISSTIFTLDNAHLPVNKELHAAYSFSATGYVPGRIDIPPTGEVFVVSGGNSYLSLDGISFRAAPVIGGS